jgi:hypothetical protein
MALLFCGASWQMFHVYTDAAHYQCYSLVFWQGSQGLRAVSSPLQCQYLYQMGMSRGMVLPFHIVPFEYPPLTLLLFSLALLAPVTLFQVTFALLMALVVLVIYWLLQRYGPRGAAIAGAFYLVLGAWGTAEGRFDLAPATLTLLCLIAADRRRWRLAYVALAFGVLLKIYPLLLFPPLFLAEQMAEGRISGPVQPLTLRSLPGELWRTLRGIRRWRWQNAGLFLGLVVLVTGLFALLNVQGAVVSQLTFFAQRPVQIESTGSTILWLATLLGHPATVAYTFGSYNVISDLDGAVSGLFSGLFIIGFIVTLLWQWRGKLDITQASVALVLIFIVTGKVFSPQYLMWIIPLLAYNGAFKRLWLVLWTCISVLTTIVYPYYYSAEPIQKLSGTPGFLEFVATRNLLLFLVTLAFLLNWWQMNQRREIA